MTSSKYPRVWCLLPFLQRLKLRGFCFPLPIHEPPPLNNYHHHSSNTF
ncbi:hypothetical protein LINPERPRIM_LOCUS30759 [Linum perenne]